MTITVHVPQTIDLARIRSVRPLESGRASVVYRDAHGGYVAGTVACDADALRALVEREAEDARMACESWA